MAGTKPKPKRIFSFHVSMSLLLRIAETPLTGAGISGKSSTVGARLGGLIKNH